MHLTTITGITLVIGASAVLYGCQQAVTRPRTLGTATRECPATESRAAVEPVGNTAGQDSGSVVGYSNPAVEAERRAGIAHNAKPLRILVVGAHPADVFDQSGGTMAHHVLRGDWVGCVTLTHGVRVHDKVVADEMFHRDEVPSAAELNKIIVERADVKTKEILRACSILGLQDENVFFLGADDAILLLNEPMIRQLARLFRKLRPDVIITHFPLEDAGIASPHATCGQIVMHAVNLAAGVDPGDRSPPHKITQIFCFGIGAAATRTHLWGAQGGFYNDVFVDITDVAAKKVACLDAIASQGYAGAYARKRIETSDGAFGSRVRFPYAEGFISMYSTSHYFLPVSEIDRERARTSDHDNLNRTSYRVNIP